MTETPLFESTKDTPNENKKARTKNYNLPILQYWFNGCTNKRLQCLITGTPGFILLENRVTGRVTWRFVLDFNHIRQKHNPGYPGTSIDKNKTYSPSGVFRTFCLDEYRHHEYLAEMMKCMPLSSEQHRIITADSHYGDIDLSHFKKREWAWGLQSEDNFKRFCEVFRLPLQYDSFVDSLKFE